MEKYLRLRPDNTGEFSWARTKDGQIIVRDKFDGEIILHLERPLDQKDLISGAYHEGINTGLEIHSRYIGILEKMIAPLMPDYVDEHPDYDFTEDTIKSHTLLIAKDEQGADAEHILYEIYIPKNMYSRVTKLSSEASIHHAETFFSVACEQWISPQFSKENLCPYAAPMTGKTANVLLTREDRDQFILLAEKTNFAVVDLIYTAIKKFAEELKTEDEQTNHQEERLRAV